jgi:hypothetical protein
MIMKCKKLLDILYVGTIITCQQNVSNAIFLNWKLFQLIARNGRICHEFYNMPQ